jgi:hypothetical protein
MPEFAAPVLDESAALSSRATGELEKVDVLGEACVEIGAGVRHGPGLGLRRELLKISASRFNRAVLVGDQIAN